MPLSVKAVIHIWKIHIYIEINIYLHMIMYMYICIYKYNFYHFLWITQNKKHIIFI